MTTAAEQDDRGNRWYYTKEQLENCPSRESGFDADKELSYRQQAANFIQDMGQKLEVSQLCINTAIVYMHRFYYYHSFARFHRNAIAPAAIFLAAKVEEQPRKLEHIIKVTQVLVQRNSAPLQRNPAPIDRRSDQYKEQAQELVMNENILLMTLGFDVAIEHPHTFIVNFCHVVKASKDLSQASYFMATNSLHLTTFCLQYKPAVVACFCIHLVCRWSNCQIPNSNENRAWYSYMDPSVTVELLEQLTNEYLAIFDKCPSRLKRRIQNSQVSCQNSLSRYSFDVDSRSRQSSVDPTTTSSVSSSQPHPHQSQSNNQPGCSKVAHHSSKPLKNPTGIPPMPANHHQNLPSTLAGKLAADQRLPNTNLVIPSQPMIARPSTTRGHQRHPEVGAFSSAQQQHQQQPQQQQQHHHKTSSNSSSSAHVAPSTSRLPRPGPELATHNSDAILRLEHVKKPPPEVKQEPRQTIPLTPSTTSMMGNNTHYWKNNNTKSSSSGPTVAAASVFRRENGLHQDNKHRGSGFVSTTQSEVISNVVKEVALAKQYEKQRLSAAAVAKVEPLQEDVKPTAAGKSHSIFSPPPVAGSNNSFEERLRHNDVTIKSESSSTPKGREVIPTVKKVETESVPQPMKEARSTTACTLVEQSIKGRLLGEPSTSSDTTAVKVTIPDVMDGVDGVKEEADECVSHSHKKKKKHKEKDKKHDKEKHHHKEKKKHKEDKYRNENKDKEAFRVPEHIKITIPKEKLGDIPVKVRMPSTSSYQSESLLARHEMNTTDAPVKLKIKIPKERHGVTSGESEQPLTRNSTTGLPADSEDKVKSSRKRHHKSDHDDVSKKYPHYESESR